jgi:hypothetical protein
MNFGNGEFWAWYRQTGGEWYLDCAEAQLKNGIKRAQ